MSDVANAGADAGLSGPSLALYVEKIKVVPIRTRFDPTPVYHLAGDVRMRAGVSVILKTTDGQEESGVVSDSPRYMEARYYKAPLPKVLRSATEGDAGRISSIEVLEDRAFNVGKKKITEMKLPMKLINVKYAFSKKKGTFFFSSEGRVDFRCLVKALAENFSIRVEMRQIGVRDQSGLAGGCGDCGRELCCSTFIKGFDPISVRMAKDQNLSLNPMKLAGQCGRLKCCLRFEHAHYVAVKKRLPSIKKRVGGCNCTATVVRQNILAEEVTLALETGDRITIHADGLTRMANGQYTLVNPIGE
jgi:cell fate regulator YaaT (PSP1 superfamily)